MATIRPLRSAERDWANERYAEVDFARADETHFVLVAEVGGARAGLGRLVPIAPGVAELSGITVLPEFRGRGIAREIVGELLARSNHRRLYCIPFAHLESFYAGFGFVREKEGAELPEAIAKKFGWCCGHYAAGARLMVRDVVT